MLQILVLPDKTLPTDHSFLNGVFVKCMPRMGIKVSFFGLHEGDKPPIETNIQYITEPAWGKLKRIQLMWLFIKLVLSGKRFDAVFTRNDPILMLLGVVYKLFFGSVHFHQISFLHAEGIIRNERRLSMRKLYAYADLLVRRSLLRFVDALFLISDRMRDEFIERYPKYGFKFYSLPLGIAGEEFADVPAFESRTVDAVYIGTLKRQRQLTVLVDAIRIYKERYGSITVEVWGGDNEPRDKAFLAEYIKEKEVSDQIKLKGSKARLKIIREIMRARVGLSIIPPTSQYVHSSPTKLMEYMAAGCAVLATQGIIEQDYIVRASGAGILVGFDPESVAQGLHKLISQTEDTKKMADVGRAYILEHRDYRIHTELIINMLTSEKTHKRAKSSERGTI